MVKRISVPTRIDPELNKIIKDIAVDNQMNIREASRELARIHNVTKFKLGKKRLRLEDVRF